MASTLGCQFNFEVPLSILQSVSTSQSGHQYEMLGDFHVNEFSRKHLKVLGENADGIFRFSLKEKQTIEGWHTVFDQVWKCHITSIQSVSTSKPVDDEPLKPSLGTAPAGNLIKKEADFSSEAGGDEDIPYDDIADTCYYDHGDDHDDEEENDTGNETNIKLEVTETKELNLEKVPAKRCQFTCSECNKNFSTIYTLRRHAETTHNTTSTEKKPKQSFSLKHSAHLFEKNLSLCKMLGILPKSSKGEKSGCLVCSKVLSGKCQIGRHITEKHLVPLDRYWKLVTTDDPNRRKSLINDILREEFDQRSKKKLEKAGRKTCKCPGCGKLFTSAKNVLIHIRKKCCSATANADAETIQELLSKVEALSAQSYQPNIVNRDEYSIACPYCGEPRVGRSIFKHLRVAHASEENLETCLAETEVKYTELAATRDAMRKWNAEATRKSEGVLFSCKFCQRQFNDRSSYHKHMKHSCTSNPDRTRRFYCKCGRRYISQQSLDAHRSSKNCQKGPNFQCDVCGKVYTSKSSLYKHRRGDHGKKFGKHCCPVCSKRFFEKRRLERHMRCHTDARLFQCEICGKNYKSDVDVQKHKTTVHFNKYPYYCQICGHGVAKKSYLAAHKCGKVRRVQDQENPEASSALAQDQKPAISDTHKGAINQLVVAPNDPSTHSALTNVIFSQPSDLFL